QGARCDLDRGRGAVQGAPVEAVRVSGMGPVGLRRPAVRPRHGEVADDAQAHRVRCVLLRQARLRVGSRVEAAIPSRVPRADHAARMIAWDDILALGRELPETEETTHYGRPALKVRGKAFVSLRERPDALVVRCDGEEKPLLLDARPDVVFTTPH